MKKEDLDKLRKWLPRGYAQMIAKCTNVSRVTVYNVSSGRFKNDVVMDALITLALENKKKEEEQKMKILSL